MPIKSGVDFRTRNRFLRLMVKSLAPITLSVDSPGVMDLLQTILNRIARGETLLQVCEDEKDSGCPSADTIRTWIAEDKPKGFARLYARARISQHDSWADQIVRHSDTPLIGTIEKTLPDGTMETTVRDNVERSKLMVDSRKWLLSKLRPNTYGDRYERLVIDSEDGPSECNITLHLFKNSPARRGEKRVSEIANGSDTGNSAAANAE